MDISSLLGAFLSSDGLSGMSKKTKVSKDGIQDVLTAALPALLSGAVSQSKSKKTSASFLNALAEHSKNDTSDLSDFLGNVDMDDGAKIVAHLLGSESSDTIGQIAKKSGVSKTDTKKVLSAAAPLLMSLLGQETNAKEDDDSIDIGDIMGALVKNVDMGDLLTGLLSSGTKKKSASKKKKDDDDDSPLDMLFDILT